jgi:hypothetical protein
MSTADLIELLGSSVDDRLIERGEAAQLLVEQTEGGLTKVGALLLLIRWRAARGDYERAFKDAADGLPRG